MEKIAKIIDSLSSDKAFYYGFGVLGIAFFVCGFFNTAYWALSAACFIAKLILGKPEK